MRETKNMKPRPVTKSEYINEMNPIDAVNFIAWVGDFAIPKISEQIAEIIENHSPFQIPDEFINALAEQNKLLEDINRDLEAANEVARWFMEEAPKHIIMMAEEGDDIVITYDNEDNWLEVKSPVEQSADKTKQE